MSQPISIVPTQDFKRRSKLVLDDPGQRKNFRGAMDFCRPNGAPSLSTRPSFKVCVS